MAMGHGATCSLAMEPTRTDGYYPCVDFGPYRMVKEYGRVSGFVVGKGRKPFKVFVSDDAGERFVVGGPWESDMAGRLALTFGTSSGPTEGGDAAEAGDYVRKVIEPARDVPAQAIPPQVPPSAVAAPAPAVPQRPAAVPVAPAPGTSSPTAAGPPDEAIRAALEAIGGGGQ
jgi:hypothetical protein